MKLVTVAEMQAIEREADRLGWTFAQMMEEAGQGLAEIVQAFYGYEEPQAVLGLVGSGNNGGDTLIALEALARDGWQARAYLARPRQPNDPLLARLRAAGGEWTEVTQDADFTQLDTWLDAANVILDGVFGTGVRLPLEGDAARVLGHVKVYPGLPDVVAVDCPSGVDLETGQADETTLAAELTACMAAVKTGLLRFPAYRLAGTLEVVEIGLPEGLETWQAVRTEMLTDGLVRRLLPARPDDGHKGSFGTVSVLAGSLNYTGAAALCAEAAYRIGAGLVQIAAPAPLHAALAGRIPEATWVLLPHEMGVIAEAAMDVLARPLEKTTLLVWGPGFGLEEPTAAFVRRLLRGAGFAKQSRRVGFVGGQAASELTAPALPPMVVDADGLKLLARVEGWIDKLPKPAVLTPHPGEMAILTGKTSDEIQADRLGTASRYAQEWGHVVVLKGAMTVVAAPDGQVRVVPVASSALAHAGTGDVLAGMIGGLRAQGLDAFAAASAAAWIHAQAGLLAAETLGHPASVLASDVIAALPEVLAWVW